MRVVTALSFKGRLFKVTTAVIFAAFCCNAGALSHGKRLQQRPQLSDQMRKAVEAKDLQKIRALIERGAPANPSDGSTPPLFVAVTYDDFPMVRLLLAHGADINGHEPGGESVLMWAVDGYLTDHATYRDNTPMIRYLLAHGADVNETLTFTGSTALMEAVGLTDDDLGMFCFPRAVKALLQHGAHVNVRDSDGNTPLLLTVYAGGNPMNRKRSYEIAKMLVRYGAKVRVRNNDGETPIHRARVTRQYDLLRFLEMHAH